MRLNAPSMLAAALASLAFAGAAEAQSPYGYWYAPPPPAQYAPPQAPYWSVAYDPFFMQPMWGYGYPATVQPWPTAYAGAPRPPAQAWPTAYAGAPRTTTRARTARARDPFWAFANDPFFTDPFFSDPFFSDPFFTAPWGFDSIMPAWGGYGGAAPRAQVMAGAGVPVPGQAWAGAAPMLGYGSFASDDFWNWARFGDFGGEGAAGGSASAYSYTARNSNGQCVHVERTTRAVAGGAPQTVTHRENCGAAMPAGPDAGYYDGE